MLYINPNAVPVYYLSTNGDTHDHIHPANSDKYRPSPSNGIIGSNPQFLLGINKNDIKLNKQIILAINKT